MSQFISNSTFSTNSAKETEKFGEIVGRHVREMFSKNGIVVALYGGLGMGKTTFVYGFSKAFDTALDVSSPTYAVVHDYGGLPPLIHFDMYRIDGWDDLETTGFFDYLDSKCIIVVEWSENIRDALPENVIKIEFTRNDNGCDESSRVITWSENLGLDKARGD